MPSLPKLSKRERLILYLAVLVVFSVLFERIILRQVTNKLNKLSQEIPLEEKRLRRCYQVLSRKDLIFAEHEQLSAALKQSQSDEEEKSRLLSEIEKIARSSSVELRDIAPGTTKREGSYQTFTVEIELESKIDQLVDFIYQLERSPRLLRVKDFYLVPKKKQSAALKARMTITEVLILSP